MYIPNYAKIKLKLRNLTIRGNSITRYRDEGAKEARVELSGDAFKGRNYPPGISTKAFPVSLYVLRYANHFNPDIGDHHRIFRVPVLLYHVKA